VASMQSIESEAAAATSTPQRPSVLQPSQSVQDDARLMFEERDTSMTDDWASESESGFARGQATVIGIIIIKVQIQSELSFILL